LIFSIVERLACDLEIVDTARVGCRAPEQGRNRGIGVDAALAATRRDPLTPATTRLSANLEGIWRDY